MGLKSYGKKRCAWGLLAACVFVGVMVCRLSFLYAGEIYLGQWSVIGTLLHEVRTAHGAAWPQDNFQYADAAWGRRVERAGAFSENQSFSAKPAWSRSLEMQIAASHALNRSA